MSRLRPLGLLSLALSVVLLGCAGQPVAVSAPAAGVRAGKAAGQTPGVAVPEELQTPAVVSPEERMQAYPSPGEYVAFSLHVAQKLLAGLGTGPNYRVVYPEVYNLGGMTQILGLVYDRQGPDLVLVGKYDPERQPLTLDDWAVALRARFIHNTWPEVSIDPTEETPKSAMQRVRFAGGIDDTQVGADLLEADYRLKQIAMGLLPAGIPGLPTYWELGLDRGQERPGDSLKSSARFWFYPVSPSVAVRQDVVAVKGLTVGVFTEVLAAEVDGRKVEDLSTFQDPAGDRFAKTVSARFTELAKVHSSLARVQGLDELVALTRAIEVMEEQPDLTFWLRDYQVKQVWTKKALKVLRRYEEYQVQGARVVSRRSQELSGGVHLVAIALRLKAGDVTALKEAVLKTRPHPEALSWSFVVGEWLIPTAPGMLTLADVVPLSIQAQFLHEKKYHDEVITLYGKILALDPDLDWVYNNRGVTYAEAKREYDRAIADFNKALEINPSYAEAYNNRGAADAKRGEYNRAIADFNKALEINPRFVKGFYNRGFSYSARGEYDRAIADFNRVLELDARNTDAYAERGLAFKRRGEYDRAIADFNKALDLHPRLARAYINRGEVYRHRDEPDRAIAEFNKALEIDPGLAEAYSNRGVAYAEGKGELDRAIADFNKALELNPSLAEVYNNRGFTYAEGKGELDRAIQDYNNALELNPRSAPVYVNRGKAYGRKRLYDRAVSDFTTALEINPRNDAAYAYRGAAYVHKGLYNQALADYNSALEINARSALAYFGRGSLYMVHLGNTLKGCSDWKQACELGLCQNYDFAKRKGAC